MDKLIQIRLDSKTLKCSKAFKLIKGKSFQDVIVGETPNIEKYVQLNDTLITNKRYFNKKYKLKVIKIKSINNDNVIAITQSEEYIPKYIIKKIEDNDIKIKGKNIQTKK